MESLKYRYFTRISFHGGNYHGWQVQPNALSVQQLIEEALSTILSDSIRITGAGRTDTGVHARDYVFHFDLDKPITKIDKLIYGLNSFLPHEVAIHDIRKVKENAHARFDAISRMYEYHIHIKKDPFLNSISTFIHYIPDIELMNEASKLMLEYEDFTSFCKLHSDNTSNICNVKEAGWIKHGHTFVFTIKADRFLRNMVRSITGTLLELGRGKITISEFKTIIEMKDRTLAGPSLPPEGLFFTEVLYPNHIYCV